jgi:hypothetical protein
MALVDPPTLIALLHSPRLRVRTGLWLIPRYLLGQEREEAARLNIDAIDVRQQLLSELPEGTRFSGLNASRLIELLDELCSSDRGTSCLLIYNFDLLLARLTHEERGEVWDDLYQYFSHRSRGLLIVLPEGAAALLPGRDRLKAWRQDGRLAETIS